MRDVLNLVTVGLVAASVGLSGCGDASSPDLEVLSPNLKDGARLDDRFTCTGDNEPPTLRWSGGPQSVQGWAVVAEDPEAPVGTFTLWLVTGLGPSTRSVGPQLPEAAVASLTSAGQAGYSGPCPPTGEEHRIRYRVHALRRPLTLEPATSVQDARRRIEELSLDAAELEVTARLT